MWARDRPAAGHRRDRDSRSVGSEHRPPFTSDNEWFVHRHELRVDGSGLLFHGHRVAVPIGLRHDLLELFHDTPTVGAHVGADRLAQKVASGYFWPALASDAKEYVARCTACQQRKPGQKLRMPWVRSGFAVSAPNDMWVIDFVGPLPESSEGHRWILTAIDKFSRYVMAAPLRVASAAAVVEQLTSWFVTVGFPLVILSDNGSAFTAALTTTFTQHLGVLTKKSTPYFAPAHGAVERAHRMLHEAMAPYLLEDHCEWHSVLQHTAFGLNATPSRVTGFAPFELFHGRPPLALWWHQPTDPARSDPELAVDGLTQAAYGARVASRLRQVARRAGAAQRRYHASAEAADHLVGYEPREVPTGAVVWRQLPPGRRGEGKWNPRWDGPWVVVGQGRPGVLYIRHKVSGRRVVANIRTLKWPSRLTETTDCRHSDAFESAG